MAISLLGIIDAISPKDRGSLLLSRDVAYGPDARQKLDIYAPRTREGALPVVVFIYGGSWQTGAGRPIGSRRGRWRRWAISSWCPTRLVRR